MAETGNWSKYYITKAGRDLRQRWIAEGKKPVFTRAAIGSGRPESESEIDTMTGLVSFLRNVVIKKSYAIEANHLCIVRVENIGLTQDEFMTEVAIFAKHPDEPDSMEICYGYSYIFDDYVKLTAQTEQNIFRIYELTLDTYLSRATEIQIIFDARTVYVTHEDLDEALRGSSTHPLITLHHGLNRYPLCLVSCLDYAAGIAPAGEGPPGGTNPVTIRTEIEYLSRDEVRILVPEGYARPVAAVRELGGGEYAVIYAEGVESLIITII